MSKTHILFTLEQAWYLTALLNKYRATTQKEIEDLRSIFVELDEIAQEAEKLKTDQYIEQKTKEQEINTQVQKGAKIEQIKKLRSSLDTLIEKQKNRLFDTRDVTIDIAKLRKYVLKTIKTYVDWADDNKKNQPGIKGKEDVRILASVFRIIG